MKIKITEENEKIFLTIDENKSELSFDKLDSLIEEFISYNEKPEIECDNTLSNYKTLIEEIYNETQSSDFLKAVEEAQKYGSEESN